MKTIRPNYRVSFSLKVCLINAHTIKQLFAFLFSLLLCIDENILTTKISRSIYSVKISAFGFRDVCFYFLQCSRIVLLYKLAKLLPTHCRKWHYRNCILAAFDANEHFFAQLTMRCQYTSLHMIIHF